MDKKDMKIAAYEERIAQLTTEYERKVADLRVELTVKDNELRQAQADLESATRGRTQEPADTVEGEVV